MRIESLAERVLLLVWNGFKFNVQIASMRLCAAFVCIPICARDCTCVRHLCVFLFARAIAPMRLCAALCVFLFARARLCVCVCVCVGGGGGGMGVERPFPEPEIIMVARKAGRCGLYVYGCDQNVFTDTRVLYYYADLGC